MVKLSDGSVLIKHLYWKLTSIFILVVSYVFSNNWSASVFGSFMGNFSWGDKSSLFYADLTHLLYQEALWWLFFGWLAWVIYDQLKTDAGTNFGFFTGNRLGLILLPALAFILSILVSKYGLLEFPNSSDEYVYLFQAEGLSRGKLFEQPHPLPQFFNFNHLYQGNDIWIGRFPPGWPLVLSISFITGIPPMWINPLIGVVTLLVFFRFAQYKYGQDIASWSVLVVASSSFFLFTSASYFSHSLALLCSVLFVYFLIRFLDSGKLMFGLLAGFFIGLSFTTRYYTALLFALPFALYFLESTKVSFVRAVFIMIIGFMPWFIFLLGYNFLTTGDMWLPVTVWVDPDEGLGFVKGHTLLQGIEHVIRRLLLFVYWTSPGFLIVYCWFFYRKFTQRLELLRNPEDWTFILLLLGYFFYHEIGGNQYGPRFYFEAFPFMVLFITSKVFQSSQKKIVYALFLAAAIYGVFKLPAIAFREQKIILERMDLYAQVEREKLQHAVVFVASSTGVIRPMPIGDLLRNDKQYNNSVLYARDLGDENRLLMEYYKDRTFYRYKRNPDLVEGMLERIK